MTANLDQHATCHHKTYDLDCAEFERLLQRAGHACEICGTADVKLWIDHDHDEDRGSPVRGLVCAKCNAVMRRVDAGTYERTPVIDGYLSRTLTKRRKVNWYARVFSCPADLWVEAQSAAKSRGESVAEVLRRGLREYIEANQ